MKKPLVILAAVVFAALAGWTACAVSGSLLCSGTETPLFAWLGYWQMDDEVSIGIRMDGDDFLLIEGLATYGMDDPDRVENGSVQAGAFAVRLPVEWVGGSDVIEFAVGEDGPLPHAEAEDIDCKLRLRLGYRVLMVNDNGRCGGANVSFTGEYRRPER